MLVKPLIVAAACASLASCATEVARELPSSANRVPLQFVDRFPSLIARVNGGDIRLLLDMGSRATVQLNPSYIRTVGAKPTGEAVESIGMEGAVMREAVYEVSSVELGKEVFRDVEIVEDDHTEQHRQIVAEKRGEHGLVGRGLFDNYKLVIDYRDQSIRLIAPGAPDEACAGM